jgi:hypothetical protein
LKFYFCANKTLSNSAELTTIKFEILEETMRHQSLLVADFSSGTVHWFSNSYPTT